MALIVPTLSDLSLRLVAQALTCDNQEGFTTTCDYLINLLKTNVFTCVAETLLNHLVKCHASYLSDTCIQVLCPSHMKQLSLRECNQLTWLGLKEVLSRLNRLQTLNLSFCDQLISSDLDLSTDLPLFSTLTCVSMEECTSVTDNIVQQLLRQTKSLRNLNISSCDNVTDKVFLLDEELQLSREACGKNSAEYPCHLISVDVSGCRCLTSTVVRHLVTLTGPSLRSVNLSCIHADCMALLYLCGYGLLSAVSLIVGEENRRGLIEDKDLAENLRELQLLQSKCSHYSTSPSEDGETVHRATGANDRNLKRPLNNLDCGHEASVQQLIPLDSEGEYANMTDTEVQHQREYVRTKEREDNTQNKTDHVILDNGDDISVALEAYSSDSICIEELENNEFDFDSPTKRSCNRFMKSRNQSGEEKGSRTSGVDDIHSPRNPCSWDLQVDETAEEGVDFLLSVKFCPEARTVAQQFSGRSAEIPRPVAASLPSKHSYEEGISMDVGRDIWPNQTNCNPIDDKKSASESVTLPSTCQKQSSANLSSDLKTRNESALIESCESRDTSRDIGVGQSRPSDSCKDACFVKVNQEINREDLKPVQMYVPDLLSLDISYVAIKECSGNCLETFFQHNRNLVKFAIDWKYLTNEIVSSMTSHGEMLEEIALVECDQVTCSGIQDIGEHCQKLRGLDLKGVCFFTDAALWPCLSRGQLRHLSLAECGISDVTLRWICQYLSETIESLDLAWCDEITESGVNTLLSRDHPSLRTLSLHQGPASDHTLTLLADHCSQLTSLVLCSVRFGIDDEAVVNLAQCLSHLTKIDISWNSGLTDKSPAAFLTFCPKLEWANFAGIKRITSEPFVYLISDDGSWLKKQAMLKKHQLDRQRGQTEDKGTADKDTRPIWLPYRSGVYAPRLSYLDLVYCDLVDDFHLSGIIAVCRGSLKIQDYHGQVVEPVWFSQCTVDI